MTRDEVFRGIYWIAINDDAVEMDPENVMGYISTLLLTDLSLIGNERSIAQAIIQIRCDIAEVEDQSGESFEFGDLDYEDRKEFRNRILKIAYDREGKFTDHSGSPRSA